MSKLRFPNPKKEVEPPPEVIEKVRKEDEEEIKKHVQLLKEEKRLEEERLRRLGHRKATAKNLQVQMRKRQAVAMRLRNIPMDVIAQRLHLSYARVQGMIREAMLELPEENAADLKKVLTRTITQLIGKFQTIAEEGCTKSAMVELKAIEKLMKLAGLTIERRQVEQTNMGELSPGIDVADLNLDLDTKRKLLESIREAREKKEQLQKEKEANVGKENGDDDGEPETED